MWLFGVNELNVWRAEVNLPLQHSLTSCFVSVTYMALMLRVPAWLRHSGALSATPCPSDSLSLSCVGLRLYLGFSKNASLRPQKVNSTTRGPRSHFMDKRD